MTLLGMLALIVLTFRRHKTVCFLLLFYLIVYLPTSNFLIIIGSIMAERFLYLPLLGFVGCLVLGVEALARRIQIPPPTRQLAVYSLLTAIAMGFAVRAAERNEDWLSDITLWTAAAKMSPDSFRSYQSKAFALFERYGARLSSGAYIKDPAQRQMDIDEVYQTAEHAKPIVDVLPPEQNSSRLYLHLGMYYCAKGESLSQELPDGSMKTTEDAVPWFRAAEKVLQEGVVIDRTFNGINHQRELARKRMKDSEIPDVGLPPIYFYLGNAYIHLGEWQKALQAYKYEQHLDPGDVDAYVHIAMVYLQIGKSEEAAITLFQALMLNSQQMQLWPPLAQSLAQINHSGRPAVTVPRTTSRSCTSIFRKCAALSVPPTRAW